MKVIPYHILAEAVYRRNLGVMNQRLLLLKMLVLRIFFKTLFQSQSDSLSHFCGSCLREGHHKKPVHIERTFLLTLSAHKGENSLYENGCLS